MSGYGPVKVTAGVLLGLALLGLSVVTTEWLAGEPARHDVLARVGDEVITVADFTNEMERQGGHLPGQYQTVAQRQALLDAMVRHRLLLAAARSSGLESDPEVRRTIEKILIDRFQRGELDRRLAQVSITAADVEAYYQDHLDQYRLPARRQAALLRMALPENPERAQSVHERMAEALAELSELEVDPGHFGRVARQYSEDRASRYQGGVIGWLEESPRQPYRWGVAVQEALNTLESEGDMSEPFVADGYLQVVRLVGLEAASVRPLEQVEQGIRRLLERQRREQVEADFVAEITGGVPVETDQEMLGRIQPLSEPAYAQEKQPPAVPGG